MKGHRPSTIYPRLFVAEVDTRIEAKKALEPSAKQLQKAQEYRSTLERCIHHTLFNFLEGCEGFFCIIHMLFDPGSVL